MPQENSKMGNRTYPDETVEVLCVEYKNFSESRAKDIATVIAKSLGFARRVSAVQEVLSLANPRFYQKQGNPSVKMHPDDVPVVSILLRSYL